MLYMLDLDGTLIEGFLTKNEDGSFGEVLDYDRVAVLPGRHEKLYKLVRDGRSGHLTRFALVTNQAGVAFGHQTVNQVREKVARASAQFELFFGRPVTFHICFHHPEATDPYWRQDPCPRRKPGAGMLIEALEAHDMGTKPSIYVGDMDSDAEAARAAREQGYRVGYYDAEQFFSG